MQMLVLFWPVGVRKLAFLLFVIILIVLNEDRRKKFFEMFNFIIT